MFVFEFKFRIKGTYFYSSSHLLKEKILIENQKINLFFEPQNPFDPNAITLWLSFENLPKHIQSHQILEHEKWQLNILHYQYLYRLPTKLSINLSTKLPTKRSTAYKTTSHSAHIDLSPQSIAFKDLHWQFIPHRWLIGYLPRNLAKLLNPIQHKTTAGKLNKSKAVISQIEPAGRDFPKKKIYANLQMGVSLFDAIKLTLKLLKAKSHGDYSWKLKFQKNNPF